MSVNLPVNPVGAAPVGPSEVWSSWGGDPFLVVGLLLGSWWYARGTVAIWQRVGRRRVVTGWQALAWGLAVVVLLVALASPLEALTGTLFSAHMAQHVLLTLIAAPLLAVSAPVLPLLQGLPHRVRRRAARVHERGRWLRRITRRTGWPFAAGALHAGAVWLWHLPGPYQAALHNELIHVTEHVTLLGTAVLMWWAILEAGRRSAHGYGIGILVVFLTALAHGGLSAVLTFAPTVLYPSYIAGVEAWGMSVIHDQHLAGVIMWAPGKFVHGIAVVLLAIAWVRGVETRTRARERTRQHSQEGPAPPGWSPP